MSDGLVGEDLVESEDVESVNIDEFWCYKLQAWSPFMRRTRSRNTDHSSIKPDTHSYDTSVFHCNSALLSASDTDDVS
jgi:hypothetical protein